MNVKKRYSQYSSMWSSTSLHMSFGAFQFIVWQQRQWIINLFAFSAESNNLAVWQTIQKIKAWLLEKISLPLLSSIPAIPNTLDARVARLQDIQQISIWKQEMYSGSWSSLFCKPWLKTHVTSPGCSKWIGSRIFWTVQFSEWKVEW